MSLSAVREDVRKWRAEISRQIRQHRLRRDVAMSELEGTLSLASDTASLDRMVVLISDLKEIDSSIASLKRLDSLYQDKLDRAFAQDKQDKAAERAAKESSLAREAEAFNQGMYEECAPKPLREFVRFADMGSEIEHPSPLPVPVRSVESPERTDSHYLTEEIDKRAAATMRWAPWERRKHAQRRRYEGFGVASR